MKSYEIFSVVSPVSTVNPKREGNWIKTEKHPKYTNSFIKADKHVIYDFLTNTARRFHLKPTPLSQILVYKCK